MPDRCRSCKARTFFAFYRTNGGQTSRGIFDFEPSEAGNVLALPDGTMRTLPPVQRQQYVENGGLLYTDHHATCPEAKEWRREKRHG